MATFHINRSGTNLGTFSEDEVREGFRSGKFVGTDLGWREGMATWQPLAQISEFAQETGPGGAPSPQPQFTGASAITPTPTITPRSRLQWDDRRRDPSAVLYYSCSIVRRHNHVHFLRDFSSRPDDRGRRKATFRNDLPRRLLRGWLGQSASCHSLLWRTYRRNLEDRPLLYRFRPCPRDRHWPRRSGSDPSASRLLRRHLCPRNDDRIRCTWISAPLINETNADRSPATC